MLVKLLQDWKNGPDEYVKGVTLDMEHDSDAEELIKAGIGEKVEKPESQKEQDEIDEKSIELMVQAALKKHLEAITPTRKIGQVVYENKNDDEEYFKTGGYETYSSFAQDVAKAAKGVMTKKLQEWDQKTAGHMSESDDVEGGYLVPEEFNSKLLSTMLEETIVRQRAQYVPMQTNTISYPCIVDTSHASSLFGGIVIYRTDEGSQKSPSKPKVGKVQLTLHNLTGLVYVSNQLLEDSPISIEPLLYDLFARAIAWQEDEDFINGTGAGQALGVLNAPCLVTQAKETGQAADTIIYENVIKMWSRLYPRSRGNAIWLVNTDALPQLMQMSLAVGTGGSAVYIPPGGASATPYGTLMGRPLIDSEHMQTVGDKGDILLADWSQYLIGGKYGGAVRTASSSHLRFDYNEMAYRIETRYDGQPWWSSALTPKHSTNTLSPFVALAARA